MSRTAEQRKHEWEGIRLQLEAGCIACLGEGSLSGSWLADACPTCGGSGENPDALARLENFLTKHRLERKQR